MALANFSKKPMNVRLAHSEQWDRVDTSSLVRATKTLTEDLSCLRDFIDGDVLAPNELYLNSPDKKALDDRDHRMRVAEVRATLAWHEPQGSRRLDNPRTQPDPKRHALTVRDRPAVQQDKAGDVVYKGAERRMPTPDITVKGKRPCGAWYRDGIFCRFGADCKFDHTPVDKLPSDAQKAWIAVVKGTDQMSFHPSRVTIGISSINASLAKATPVVAPDVNVEKKQAAR